MTSAPGTRRAEAGRPRRTRRSRLLLGALAGALVLVLVAVGVYVATRGDDAPEGAADAPGGASSPTPEAPDPLDDPMSPESIDLRYEALAASVTTGTTDCREAKVRAGQRERLRCDAAAGTLELVTYAAPAGLTARRDRTVTDDPGGILDVQPEGTLMAFQTDPPPKGAGNGKGTKGEKGQKGDKGEKGEKGEKGKAPEPVTFLYWDDEQALQSAAYLAATGDELLGLVEAYDATAPARPFPTAPTNRSVVRFARRWVETDACLRTPTLSPGAVEESYCDPTGPVEVFLGRFATLAQLKAYRKIVVASAIADERDVRDWSLREDGDPVGALYEYTTDDGTVSRYWDDPACLCYAEAFWAKGTYAKVERWWSRGLKG